MKPLRSNVSGKGKRVLSFLQHSANLLSPELQNVCESANRGSARREHVDQYSVGQPTRWRLAGCRAAVSTFSSGIWRRVSDEGGRRSEPGPVARLTGSSLTASLRILGP